MNFDPIFIPIILSILGLIYMYIKAQWVKKQAPGNEKMVDFAIKHNPSGRLTTPDDVAEYICLLSQANNSWLTGNVIRIDGGEDIIG